MNIWVAAELGAVLCAAVSMGVLLEELDFEFGGAVGVALLTATLLTTLLWYFAQVTG